MTTWDEPTFRTEVPRLLYNMYGYDLANFPNYLTKFRFGNHGGTLNGPSDITLKQAIEDFSIDDLNWSTEGEPDEYLTWLINNHKNVKMGTEAVHELVYRIYTDKIQFKDQLPWQQMLEVTEKMVEVVAPSTQANPTMFKQSMSNILRNFCPENMKWHNAAEAIKFLQKSGRAQSHKLTSSGEDYNSLIDKVATFSVFRLYCIGNIYVWVGDENFHDKLFMMSEKHMKQLYKTLYGMGNSMEEIRCVFGNESNEYLRAKAMLDLIINTCGKSKYPRGFYIPQAFHKLYTISHMNVLKQKVTNAEQELMQEWLMNDNLNWVDHRSFYNILDGLSARGVLEIGKIYKLLPSSDFDPCTMLKGISTKHSDPHTFGNDAVQNGDLILEQYKIIQRANFIQTYFKKYGKYPGEIKNPRPARQQSISLNKWLRVEDDEALRWDLRGCLSYTHYGTDYDHLFHDKTLAPPFMSQVLDNYKYKNLPPEEKSTLFYLLYNDNKVNTAGLLKHFPDVGCQNYYQVSPKAESHKPLENVRMFYMAPAEIRLMISEFENNISEMLTFKKGNLMGVDPILKEKRMSVIMNPNIYPDDAQVVGHPVIISYDLKDFSSRKNPKMQQLNFDFWSEVFDMEHIKKLGLVTNGSNVCMNIEGYNGFYKCEGGDFEGFFGRLNTWAHIDIMALSFKRANMVRAIALPADLGVFIDDGVAKVTVLGETKGTWLALRPNKERDWETNLKILQDMVDTTYKACGERIHEHKTVWSTIGGVMLNDTKIMGVGISPGIRAYSRISPDYENPIATIVEDMAECFARSQGALKAGTPMCVAYAKYIHECVKTIYRWTGYHRSKAGYQTLRLAIQMYTPKGFSGFGCMSLQALVTTAASKQWIENIGILRTYVRMNPNQKRLVKSILQRSILEITDENYLRDPLRVRVVDKVLIENRVSVAIIDWMLKNKDKLNHSIQACLESKPVEHVAHLAKELRNMPTVNIVMLDNIWRSTPLYYIETLIAKFKRSSTIIALLGFKTIGKLRKDNVKNVEDVLEVFTRL